eukprot:CAMPEP_0206421194 /NCGR_PEP_ID=MMETSP0324_2-20121206/1303_1 /ASSEMBLY_ACC=CAM_ASM_000836 /TAXON_ID=2866 /ORGANISM="Crypthecodinium cohnii, Strain Seligo" /LENGTH=574 /DNA_ID=CAMNT_0053885243 /DNA_START=261 /DNA_END=1988 /DNA_ORIENTATION=-
MGKSKNKSKTGSNGAFGKSPAEESKKASKAAAEQESKAAATTTTAATAEAEEAEEAESQKEESQSLLKQPRIKDGSFLLRSSWNVPFLVVSNLDLVEEIPTPNAEEWKELIALCHTLVKQWIGRKCVVLADFEGEFMGMGGELVSAAFQRTLVVDSKALAPLLGSSATKEMGLLLDLRCPEAIAVTKEIMESEDLCKAIWGADGDVTSLKYSPMINPLSISSVNVLDVQLGFSQDGRRLGMGTMLKRLPPKMVAGLPDKGLAGGVDFTVAQARHLRSLDPPISLSAAQYAVDDLHRLEVVLRTQKPFEVNYRSARNRTMGIVHTICDEPHAFLVPKMKSFMGKMTSASGDDRLATAVRVKRHMMALRHVMGSDEALYQALLPKSLATPSTSSTSSASAASKGDKGPEAAAAATSAKGKEGETVAAAEKAADAIIAAAGVVIPADLHLARKASARTVPGSGAAAPASKDEEDDDGPWEVAGPKISQRQKFKKEMRARVKVDLAAVSAVQVGKVEEDFDPKRDVFRPTVLPDSDDDGDAADRQKAKRQKRKAAAGAENSQAAAQQLPASKKAKKAR